MEIVNRYGRCNFCENKKKKDYRKGQYCEDKNGNSLECTGFDCFYLDGAKVVREAKALGIGVTDVLAMLELAYKLKGNPRTWAEIQRENEARYGVMRSWRSMDL
jgi:hypothetical protein